MLAQLMYCNDNDQFLQPTADGWYNRLQKYIQNDEMMFCPGQGSHGTTVTVSGNADPVYFPGYATSNIYWFDSAAWDPGLTETWESKPLDYFNAISHFTMYVEDNPQGWCGCGDTGYTTSSVVTKNGVTSYWCDVPFLPNPGYLHMPTYVTPSGASGSNAAVSDPPYWGDWGVGAEGRHNGFCNLGFLDGHAKAVALDAMYNNCAYYFNPSSTTAGQGQAVQ